MDPTIKASWLTALRSGDYIQGRHYLRRKFLNRDEVRLCSIGVLLETMYGPEVWEPWHTEYFNDGPRRVYETNSNAITAGLVQGLSDDLMNEVGITINQHDELISMNDHETHTFPKLADWIDENL